LLAQGDGFVVDGGPQIAEVSSEPTGPGLATKFLGYLDPYGHSDLPPGTVFVNVVVACSLFKNGILAS
jgi:hypothetical protein